MYWTSAIIGAFLLAETCFPRDTSYPGYLKTIESDPSSDLGDPPPKIAPTPTGELQDRNDDGSKGVIPVLNDETIIKMQSEYLLTEDIVVRRRIIDFAAKSMDQRLLPIFLNAMKEESTRSYAIERSSSWPDPKITQILIDLTTGEIPAGYDIKQLIDALVMHRGELVDRHLLHLYQGFLDSPDVIGHLQVQLHLHRPEVYQLVFDRYIRFEQKEENSLSGQEDLSREPTETTRSVEESTEPDRREPGSNILLDDPSDDLTIDLTSGFEKHGAKVLLIGLNSLFGAYTMGAIAKLGGTNTLLYASMGALVGGGSTYIWSMYQPFDYADPTYIGTFGAWGALSGGMGYRIFDKDSEWTRLSSIIGESLGLTIGVLTTRKKSVSSVDLLFANISGTVSVAGTVGLLGLLYDPKDGADDADDSILYSSLLVSGWAGMGYHLMAGPTVDIANSAQMSYLAGLSINGLYDGYLIANMIRPTPIDQADDSLADYYGTVSGSLLVSSIYYYLAFHSAKYLVLDQERNLRWLMYSLYGSAMGVALAEGFAGDNQLGYYATLLTGSLVGKTLGYYLSAKPLDVAGKDGDSWLVGGGLFGAYQGYGWYQVLGSDNDRALWAAFGGGLIGISLEAVRRFHDPRFRSLLLPSVPELFANSALGLGSGIASVDNDPIELGSMLSFGLLSPLSHHLTKTLMPREELVPSLAAALTGGYLVSTLPGAFHEDSFSEAGLFLGLGSGYYLGRYLYNESGAIRKTELQPFGGAVVTTIFGYGLSMSVGDIKDSPWKEIAVLSLLPGLPLGYFYFDPSELRPIGGGLLLSSATGALTSLAALRTFGGESASDKSRTTGSLLLGSSGYFILGRVIGHHYRLTNNDLILFGGLSVLGGIAGYGTGLLLPDSFRDDSAVAGSALGGFLLFPPLNGLIFTEEPKGEDLGLDYLSSFFMGGYLGLVTAGTVSPDDQKRITGGVLVGGVSGLLSAHYNRTFFENRWGTGRRLLTGMVMGSAAGAGAVFGFQDLSRRQKFSLMTLLPSIGASASLFSGEDLVKNSDTWTARYGTELGLYTGILGDLIFNNYEEERSPKYLFSSYNDKTPEDRRILRGLYGKSVLGASLGIAAGSLLAPYAELNRDDFIELNIGLGYGTLIGTGAALALYPNPSQAYPYAMVLSAGYLGSFGLAMLFDYKVATAKDYIFASDVGLFAALQTALLSYGLDLDPNRSAGLTMASAGAISMASLVVGSGGKLPQHKIPLLGLSGFLGNTIGFGLSSYFSNDTHLAALVSLLPGAMMLPGSYMIDRIIPRVDRNKSLGIAFNTGIGMFHGFSSTLLATDLSPSRKLAITAAGGSLGLGLSTLLIPEQSSYPSRKTLLHSGLASMFGFGTGFIAPVGNGSTRLGAIVSMSLSIPATIITPMLSADDTLIPENVPQTLSGVLFGVGQGISWSWWLHPDDFGAKHFGGGILAGVPLGYFIGYGSSSVRSFNNGELLLLGSGALYGGWLSFLFADLIENQGYHYSLLAALIGSNAGIVTTAITLNPASNFNNNRLYIIKLASLAGMGLFPAVGKLVGLPIKEGILIGGIAGLFAALITTSFYTWNKEPDLAVEKRRLGFDIFDRVVVMPLITVLRDDQNERNDLFLGLNGSGI